MMTAQFLLIFALIEKHLISLHSVRIEFSNLAHTVLVSKVTDNEFNMGYLGAESRSLLNGASYW